MAPGTTGRAQAGQNPNQPMQPNRKTPGVTKGTAPSNATVTTSAMPAPGLDKGCGSVAPGLTTAGLARRRILDILQFALELIAGPKAWAAFKQEMLRAGRLNKFAFQEVSESEYQAAIQQVRREAPHFLRWLQDESLPADQEEIRRLVMQRFGLRCPLYANGGGPPKQARSSAPMRAQTKVNK
jgi:hypothetical protein